MQYQSYCRDNPGPCSHCPDLSDLNTRYPESQDNGRMIANEQEIYGRERHSDVSANHSSSRHSQHGF
jgi:hypothetical protein